jgi:hypothetical protein
MLTPQALAPIIREDKISGNTNKNLLSLVEGRPNKLNKTEFMGMAAIIWMNTPT